MSRAKILRNSERRRKPRKRNKIRDDIADLPYLQVSLFFSPPSLSLFLSSSSTRSVSRATRTFVFALEDVWTTAWRKILGRIFRYYLFHYPPSLSFSTRIFLLPSPLSFFSGRKHESQEQEENENNVQREFSKRQRNFPDFGYIPRRESYQKTVGNSRAVGFVGKLFFQPAIVLDARKN